MKKNIIFFSICIFCVFVCSYLFYKAATDVYMQPRMYACKVLSKIDNQYETHTKSGYHFNRDFILVLEAEGKQFSLDVEPATWATAKEDTTLFFTIAPYQLDYYDSSPVRWQFWALIITAICSVFIICLALFLYIDE